MAGVKSIKSMVLLLDHDDDNDLEEAPPEDMEEPWTEMEEF